MDETEDGGIGADPESKHEDRADREGRRLEQLAEGKAKIVDHSVSEMHPPARLDSNIFGKKGGLL
jgi:hypothetical protein